MCCTTNSIRKTATLTSKQYRAVANVLLAFDIFDIDEHQWDDFSTLVVNTELLGPVHYGSGRTKQVAVINLLEGLTGLQITTLMDWARYRATLL